MLKRPPLKRPKGKPGMPKDFVFIDLSPVQSSEDDECGSESSASSVSSTDKPLPMSMTNESFSSFEDDSGCFNLGGGYNYQLQEPLETQLLGLGLMNMPSQYPQPSVVELAMKIRLEQVAFQRFLQFQAHFLQSQSIQVAETPQVQAVDHRRSKSTSSPRRKSAGGFQFKTYKGPNNVKKPLVRKHRRCVLQPTVKLTADVACLNTDGADNFNYTELNHLLQAPKDNNLDSHSQFDLSYTPLTDLSDVEAVDTLSNPINMDILGGCESNLFKEDFDMSTFVSI